MEKIMFYVTLHYPNKEEFFTILDLLAQYNVKYLEIGIPVSNPFMDGPTIQATHKEVLGNNLTSQDVMDTLEKIKNEYNFKVIIMTYYEGIKKFRLTDLKNELYDGILCVDKFLTKKDFKYPVQLYAPHMDDGERVEKIKNNETFAYVLSGEGRTGSFDEVPDDYLENVKYLKENVNLPVFVGFGIRTNEDVNEVCANGADGVIIGTSFLKHYIEEGIDGLNQYLNSFKKV